MIPEISIILPCHNEEKNVELVCRRLKEQLKKMQIREYEIILIDDGSVDKTLMEIKKAVKGYRKIKFLSFSRNFGQQSAIKAGMDYAKGRCVVSMDADLQHPPELLTKMVDWWKKGFDVVYTLRDDKETPMFKRVTAKLFYKIINFLSETKIESGSADFRLLDRKVVEAIKEIDDAGVFLRGLVGWCGFKQKAIIYTPLKRHAGRTSYTLKRMVNLAVNGVMSFSVKPLRLASILGIILILASPGGWLVGHSWWAVGIMLLEGTQMLMLGIIGEYLGRVFVMNKRRPNYIVAEKGIK